MGFLSAYEGTRRVPVGDPERGYWVEIREVLSQGAKERAEQELVGKQKVDNGNVVMDLNFSRYRELMVLSSIKDWNLDDDNGQIWPINAQSVRRLPGPIFDKLWEIVDKMNEPASAAEQRQFPDEGDVRNQNGQGRTAESWDVLAGAPVLDETRSASRGSGEAPMA